MGTFKKEGEKDAFTDNTAEGGGMENISHKVILCM